MSQMLRPADIATIIQEGISTNENINGLNGKAIEMFDALEVTDKIVFNVTADFQLYERMQKAEYEVDDYEKFTPVIISRVNHYEYPADYLRYEESYTIGIYGYADQLESIEKILKAWVVDENTRDKSMIVDSFRITKETADVSFALDIEPMDGSLYKRVAGAGGFSWSFLDGIMTSYDTIITIDDEEMPYISFEFQDAPGTIQTQAFTTAGQTSNNQGMSFYEIQMILPYISTSDVIKDLYKEFYEGSYNKSHTLTYYDSALDETFPFEVRMASKQFYDTQPKVLDFAVSFVRYYPTVVIAIDEVEVPVINFGISSNAEVSTTTGINRDVSESAYLGNSYSINMDIDISNIANTKTEELLAAILNQEFQTPHTIELTKGSTTHTYNV